MITREEILKLNKARQKKQEESAKSKAIKFLENTFSHIKKGFLVSRDNKYTARIMKDEKVRSLVSKELDKVGLKYTFSDPIQNSRKAEGNKQGKVDYTYSTITIDLNV